MQAYSNAIRLQNKTIGFVPTMGFLHLGHLSLIEKSKCSSDLTVVSIYVNPAQFGKNEDLSKYPRDFDRDVSLLKEANTDVLFLPTDSMIYPKGYQTYIDLDLITQRLEGELRPGHFRGVATVVAKLFNIVKPHVSFFGQKDAQQCALIEAMTKDLNFDIKIEICPIIREADGLALSSRNVYLSESEREDSLVLSKSLLLANDLISKGEVSTKEILSKMNNLYLHIASAKLEYISISKKENFFEVETLENGVEYFILVACKIGKTRLIDNLLITL